MMWRDEQKQAQRTVVRVADNARAKEVCPLCAINIPRTTAFYAQQFYPNFYIYSCAMWGDVYHTVAASLGDQVGGAVLVRAKVEK